MTSYYCTCESGLQDVIGEFICEDDAGARILRRLEGAVEFSSPHRTIDAPAYVKNLFYLLHACECRPGDSFKHCLGKIVAEYATSRRQTAQKTTYHLEHGLRQVQGTLHGRSPQTFRVMTYDRNSPIGCDRREKERLEGFIGIHTGLRLDHRNPDTEVWVQRRSEGIVYLLLRLSERRAGEKELARGELKPELAHTLCRLSAPMPEDIFLDPFCGSGAIPLERAAVASYRYIFAVDNDESLIIPLRKRVRKDRRSKMRTAFFAKIDDATRLEGFEDGFITKVVSDPPWGVYSVGTDIPRLYRDFLSQLQRILSEGGRAVLLVGRDIPLEEYCLSSEATSPRRNPGDETATQDDRDTYPQLQIRRRIPLLVSGRKADIYLIEK